MTLAPDRTAPVEVDERADAVVIHVRVAIDDGVSETLRHTLSEAIDRRGHVVVDLAGAPTVGPAGLGVLVRAHQRARRSESALCLAAPSRFVITVLHTMHVDGVFPQFGDCDAAIDWLRHKADDRPWEN
jgi:anti-anti-sigma factor